jgi:hypothetical protein
MRFGDFFGFRRFYLERAKTVLTQIFWADAHSIKTVSGAKVRWRSGCG